MANEVRFETGIDLQSQKAIGMATPGSGTDGANKSYVDGYAQPLDSDLTTIAGLTATTDNVIQSVAGAWASRTMAQLKTALALVKGDVGLGNVTNNAQVTGVTAGDATITIGGSAAAPTVAVTASTYQPLDSDLTTIAGLTATTDNVIQSVGSAWASRTMAQLKTALALVKGDVGLGNVDNLQQQPLDTDLTTIAGLTATTDNMIQSVSSAWASRTPAQVKTALALNNLDNTSDAGKPVSTAQQTALDLKSNLASPTFTGTVTTAKMVNAPVTLTDAATIAVNAALGNHFTVTLAGNRTMGAPTNPTHGQKVLFEIKQDTTGTRTLAWTTGTDGFIFGTDIPSVTLTTTLSKTDFVGAVYNSTAQRWRIIAVAKGY